MIHVGEYDSNECMNESTNAIEGPNVFSEKRDTNCKGLLSNSVFSNQAMCNSDSGSPISGTSQDNL